MLNTETFREMRENLPMDFVLKTIQADVILSKSKPIESDFERKGNFVARLCEDHYHNGINKEHYDAAVLLYEYQNLKLMSGLGGCDPVFPEGLVKERSDEQGQENRKAGNRPPEGDPAGIPALSAACRAELCTVRPARPAHNTQIAPGHVREVPDHVRQTNTTAKEIGRFMLKRKSAPQRDLLTCLAQAVHYAQDNIADLESWPESQREDWLLCTSHQAACFLAQNTVRGHDGVETQVILDELLDVNPPLKSIEYWKGVLQTQVDFLGGWSTPAGDEETGEHTPGPKPDKALEALHRTREALATRGDESCLQLRAFIGDAKDGLTVILEELEELAARGERGKTSSVYALAKQGTPRPFVAVHGEGTCFHGGNLGSLQVKTDVDARLLAHYHAHYMEALAFLNALADGKSAEEAHDMIVNNLPDLLERLETVA